MMESGGTPVKLGNAHKQKRSKKVKPRPVPKPKIAKNRPTTSALQQKQTQNTSKPAQASNCVHKGHMLSENENLPEPELPETCLIQAFRSRKEAFKQLDLNIQRVGKTDAQVKAHSKVIRLPSEASNFPQKHSEPVRGSNLDLDHDQLELNRH